MPITLEITDNARPAMKQLTAGLSSPEFRGDIGRSVADCVRSHLAGLPPNKYGYPTTGFWQRAALATKSEVLPDGVSVSIDQVGVRQRYLGGPINPVRARRLTIPAKAEAYGHAATEFWNLKIVRAASPLTQHPALALAPRDTKPGPGGFVDADSVYYWLVGGVWQQPDPGVLPDDSELHAAALNGALNYLSRLTQGTTR